MILILTIPTIIVNGKFYIILRINTEENLIRCKDYLKKYNLLGIDLEHFGENDVKYLFKK